MLHSFMSSIQSRLEVWLEILWMTHLSISRTKYRQNVSFQRKLPFLIALISGVVSGFLGAAAGSLTFISTYNAMTYYFYTNKQYADWDFRLKNFLIYLSSDFTSSFARVFFEARKQMI